MATTPPASPPALQEASQSLSPDHGASRKYRPGIRLASVAKLDDVLAEKLQKADANRDGFLDATDVATIIDDMVQQEKMKRIYRFMTIGLFVVCVVLIGALTGITYGIVQLAKDTKVTDYSTTNYQFLVTKGDVPAVTGGAMLDLSDFFVKPESQRPDAASVTTAHGRRLIVSGSLPYYGSIRSSVPQAGCAAVLNGVNSFLVSKPAGRANAGGAGAGGAGGASNNVLSGVTVMQQAGCSTPASTGITGTVDVGGNTVVVNCPAGATTCDLYYAGTTGTTVTVPNTGFPSTDMRRSLLGSSGDVSVGDYLASKPEGCNVLANVTDRGVVKYCCKDCQELYLSDGCSCSQCFPAAATVSVLGRGVVRMDELQYGDLVRARDRATGAVVHRPVYLFGHRESDRVAMYVHITTDAGRTLSMTPGHFAPVCVGRCTPEALAQGSAKMEYRRAGDVRVGDVMVVSEESSPAFATVQLIELARDKGTFNPYVRGADLIVDGVVASPHSEWLLDSLAPAWLVPYLPYVYELMLAPVHVLYGIVGPRTAEWLAHDLGLAESGAESGHGYFAVLAGMAAPIALAAALAARAMAASRPRSAVPTAAAGRC